jgi:hypothetical protein
MSYERKDFYVDPLNGTSANNGLTSAGYAAGITGPFGSIYDVLWGGDSDPDKYGGTSDTYYLVASTADIVSYIHKLDGTNQIAPHDAGGYDIYSSRWNATDSGLYSAFPPPKFVGVNTDIVEDGTQYIIEWQMDNGPPRNYNAVYWFGDRGIGDIWRNITWKPTIHQGVEANPPYSFEGGTGPISGVGVSRIPAIRAFTSGGAGPYFVNCIFDWSNPDFDAINNTTLIGSANPSVAAKDCTFIGHPSRQMHCIDSCSVYSQYMKIYGCRFEDWNACFLHNGGVMVMYGNIIRNCNYCIYQDSITYGTYRPCFFMNNLCYNINNDVFLFDQTANDSGTGRGQFQAMHNMFIDIGGYVMNSASGWEPYGNTPTNSGAPDHRRRWGVRRNIIQNVTQGLIGPNTLASMDGIFVGWTGGSQGGLYDNFGENVFITGMTVDIGGGDTYEWDVTITGLPEAALGISGADGYGNSADVYLGSISSGTGFISSGTSGESSSGESTPEDEQARITS